ncbi:MAG: hypothetical protein IIC60_09635 [Proteobacteria bacterium]|nr:hypothetical protein [Pseudomonadota bacterium]
MPNLIACKAAGEIWEIEHSTCSDGGETRSMRGRSPNLEIEQLLLE